MPRKLTLCSLSEYGCNTNTRKFEEVSALYSTQTSAVYSGGLVYEYSEEGNHYGLVQLNGNSVKELPDFSALQSAYAGQSDPSGDGGYDSNGQPSICPSASSDWSVQNDSLPAIPVPAQKFMSQGAGAGVGLSGSGSQNAGTGSTGTATAGAGAVTATSTGTSSSKKGDSPALRAADSSFTRVAMCGLVVVISTVFGAALL